MLTTPRLLKRVHIFGTLWFLCCAAALLVLSLRQAGINWWLVFSISGYSAVLFGFLLVFYLFALFRGVVRAQCIEEHPLSTTPAYLFFYDTAPFLGGAAGLLCSIGLSEWSSIIRIVTEGTLGMTFVTWVILDSLVGGVESILPASIHHRARRLAKARAEKLRVQQENATLLESLEQTEKELRQSWEAAFSDIVAELIDLYDSVTNESQRAQLRTVETGAQAWRMGRIPCMRFVHEMLLAEMKSRLKYSAIDYAALWWDGIGSWRRPKNILSPVM